MMLCPTLKLWPESSKQVYYVETPSSNEPSQDGSQKSIQTSSPFVSPMTSPSPSFSSRDSRSSSSSQGSWMFGFGGGGGGAGGVSTLRRSKLYWDMKDMRRQRRLEAIKEEGGYDNEKLCEYSGYAFVWILMVAGCFSLGCFVLWSASRSYIPEIVVKNMAVHHFKVGQGADLTGVPTKMWTVNCSVKINVHNPASFFGIHVFSVPVNLKYSHLVVASGELRPYYQPKKSSKSTYVNIQGRNVPLYGAGTRLTVAQFNSGVPVRLVFEVRFRGDLVGKLVKVRHRKHVSCYMHISSHDYNPIGLDNSSCVYV